MEKEKLIKKWLTNELTPQEYEEVKLLDEFDDYQKIITHAKQFKAPDFETSESYSQVERRKKGSKLSWTHQLMKIAAILIIGLVSFYGFYTYFNTSKNGKINVETLVGTTQQTQLPDSSIVKLNAGSSLSFSKSTWNEKRVVHLQGEAYFEVTHGRKFKVMTPSGLVTVLGTHFDVTQREGYFRVVCYRGLVQVETHRQLLKVPAGKAFQVVSGKAVKSDISIEKPTWLKGVSSFHSVPFSEVIAELQRQYNVKIELKNPDFDKSQLFTGSFVNNNLTKALQSVSFPFNLTYLKKGNVVTLEKRGQ